MTVWPLDFLSLKRMHSTIPNFTHLTATPSTQSLSVSVCLSISICQSLFHSCKGKITFPQHTHIYCKLNISESRYNSSSQTTDPFNPNRGESQISI